MSDAFTVPAPATAEIPTITVNRAAAPNPFLDYFPKNDGKAHVWKFPAKTESDQKALRRVVSQIRKAGVEKGVTNRIVLSDPEGKDKMVTVTAWSVEKITRPRNKDK